MTMTTFPAISRRVSATSSISSQRIDRSALLRLAAKQRKQIAALRLQLLERAL